MGSDILRLIRKISDVSSELQQGAIAIGNFDGVHQGHARLIRKLIEHARQKGGPAIVFTFDPHPVRLLRPALAPVPLTWTERKAELLGKLGVDGVIAYPTDEALLTLSPEEFFSKIILDSLRARTIVEGPNFFFGRDRVGDVQLLAELCRQHSIAMEIVQPVEFEGRYISSSRIRDLIAAGEMALARDMLTQPYRIRGMVAHGAARGAGLGFPTANVDAVDTLLPAAGVYAGRAYSEGEIWPAAIHLGPNPTFGEQAVKVEVHLIGYQGTLYGKPLEVDFLQRLREIHSFDGIDQLVAQLRVDVSQAADVCQDFG